MGGVWGGGCAPSLENFLIFFSGKGAFWCILGVGACFNVTIRRVKQSRKACFVCQLPIGQLGLSHVGMADLSSMIPYT